MARQCAFCPETASLTGEHLWDSWIGELLGKSSYRMARTTLDGTRTTWKLKRLNSTANVVCGKCNSGWMGTVTARTKAITREMIVSGTPKILSPSDIVTIAAYALTKAIVADSMHDNYPTVLSFGERNSFSRTLAIPRGVQMWLASMSHSQRGLFKSEYFESPGNTSHDFKINAFTYGVAHLIFQVTITRWKRKPMFRRQTRQMNLAQNTFWDSFSIPLWPSDATPVQWPPPKHLPNNILDEFVHRWRLIEQYR